MHNETLIAKRGHVERLLQSRSQRHEKSWRSPQSLRENIITIFAIASAWKREPAGARRGYKNRLVTLNGEEESLSILGQRNGRTSHKPSV
jgi:hypothetical protein